MHAEAFSSAELRHGPYALLGPGFPALLLAQHDATQAGIKDLGAELARRGLCVMIAGAEIPGSIGLPTVDTLPEIGPILQVQSAYRLIATLSVRRGFDPDRPAHLRKVTETI